MKINQNRPDTKQVPVNTINTMLEQISDLQEDVATLQNEVDGLEQSVDTVNIEATNAQISSINATNIESTSATINTITADTEVNTAKLDANTADIDSAVIGTATVESATITDATIATANVTDLDAVNGAVQHLDSDSVETDTLEAGAINTDGITNTGDYTGKDVTVENVTASDTINAKDLNVSDTMNVKDLNISGSISGVADITLSNLETDDFKADDADIAFIKNQYIYTDTSHPLTPTPLVDNTDRYTIELPRFTGTMVLTWKDGDTVRWSATVIGNGTFYGITFGCTEGQTYIIKLFNWNNKLYIRHRANGQLFYSYNAEKELDIIHIYYNMIGWTNPKSLEELTDENTDIDVLRPSETVLFGNVNIPRSEGTTTGGIKFRGKCSISGLPSLNATDEGDMWNITNDGYTDGRFIEGAGKPINAGDDVIAVVEEVSGGEPEQDTGSIFDNVSYLMDFVVTQDNKILFSSESKNYKGINGTWEELTGPGFYNEDRQDYAMFGRIFKASNGNLIAAPYQNYWQLRYSTDNGQTWGDCDVPSMDYPENGLFAENNGRLFYTCWSNELYSDDYGITWQNLPTGEQWDERCSGGVVLPINSQSLISFGSYEGFLAKSNDNGDSWSAIGGVTDLFNKPSVSYAVLVGNTIVIEVRGNSGYDYVAFKSVDYGDTWEAVPALDGYKITTINNELFLIDANGLYKTQDLGTTIEPVVSLEGIIEVKSLGSKLIISTYSRNEETYEEAYSIYYYNYEATKVLRWNKFAAGVNYENFTAQNITATTSLKLNNNDVLTTANRTDSVVQSSTDVLTSGGAYTALAGKIDTTEKGVSNGVATLDATGRVPYTQLPESAMEYKGTWDASTNTPELKDGTGTNGDFYVVSVAGTVNLGTVANPRNVTFYINDRAIYDGTSSQWARLPAGEVRSVNGMSGDVTLTASDVNALPSSTHIPADPVQADWNETDTTALDYIKNKPTIPAAQVNADWNASSGVAEILNKPTIPTVVDTVADGNMNAVTSNAVYDYVSSMNHNVPRWVNGSFGKDITSYVTDGTLYQRLNGTNGFSLFEDIYVGDYFQMSRQIYCPYTSRPGFDYVTIAGIDTLMGNGSQSKIHYHHLVMIPGFGTEGRFIFGSHALNTSSTTSGGYKDSYLNTALLGSVVSSGSTAENATINQQLYAEFGTHLKTVEELLSNRVDTSYKNRYNLESGASSGSYWVSVQSCLMTEIEVYGSVVWSSSGFDTGTGKSQLPLFAFAPRAINNGISGNTYWLRDVVSKSRFACVNESGDAGYETVIETKGIRPRFVLGA